MEQSCCLHPKWPQAETTFIYTSCGSGNKDSLEMSLMVFFVGKIWELKATWEGSMCFLSHPSLWIKSDKGWLITDLQKTLFIRLAVRHDFVLLQEFDMLHVSVSDSCSLCSVGIQVVDGKGNMGRSLPKSWKRQKKMKVWTSLEAIALSQYSRTSNSMELLVSTPRLFWPTAQVLALCGEITHGLL